MAHRLDVVAVAIDDEGAVVVRMILRPKPRRSVVASTSRNCRIIKRLNRSAIRCRESYMAARPGFARGNPEIRSAIRAEAGRLTEVHHNFVSERRQRSLEKGFALGDIRNRNTDMIEHSESSSRLIPAMAFRRTARKSRCRRAETSECGCCR